MTARGRSPSPHPERSADLRIALALAIVSVAVFANGFGGDFVYDDVRQIQQNRLIQDPELLGEALVSDVWAFKGDRGSGWSQYWRPSFVLWLAANERLFGTEDPFGWHVLNALLHAAVVVLGHFWLRGLGMPRAIAGAAMLLFAVHPVHVESVAWISGSPDLLMSLGTLGALLCVVADLRRPRIAVRIAGWALFAFAQLAKESALLVPALVFAAAFSIGDGAGQQRRRAALLAATPYALISLVYAVVHARIAPTIEVHWDPGWGGMLLTAPRVLAFYLRQCFIPFEIGPAYPLRVVEAGELARASSWLPLGVCLAAGVALLRISRGDRVRRLGLLLFAVPLLPAFYLRAFRQEEIVHDRYLYLPLLGMLLATVPAAADLVRRVRPASHRRSGAALLGLLALSLAIATARANRTWRTEESLWTRAVETAPNASHAWAELANVHYRVSRSASDPGLREERRAEAKRCADRALALFPVTNAVLLRGMLARDEGRHAEAIEDFERILSQHPEHVPAHENLAFCLDAAGRTEEALAALRRARELVPHRYATWSEKIAVCLYRLGRTDEVVSELEGARPHVAAEMRLIPAASAVLHRLASIRAARGEVPLAREAADEYLRLTAGSVEPDIVRRRAEVEALRASLGAR